MTTRIPATVITGFLGAGKTSLIRHLLANANGQRLALVINEFGDVGIDAEIVKGCGIEGCEDDDILELANGCICCTVADDFLPTIETLIDRDVPPTTSSSRLRGSPCPSRWSRRSAGRACGPG